MTSNGQGVFNYLRNAANLDRVGVAKHEEFQGRPKRSLLQILNENSEELEKLLRSAPQIQQVLADIRKGVRTRSNWVSPVKFDTNSVPATGNGYIIDAPSLTGGYPLDSITVKSVGGAGATMEVSINGGEWIGVSANDVFQNMEIWKAVVRVTTGGAGTGRLFLTAYVPGVGGQRGL